jgi:hypothetical protein
LRPERALESVFVLVSACALASACHVSRDGKTLFFGIV